ncbi:hypothetical protein Hanom_Chr04g00318651 [Helianthus anomalus]
MSKKKEEAVREPVPMTAENLATMLLSLQGGDGNPPSVSTADEQVDATTSQVETEIEAIIDDAEEAARKKQRTDFAPNDPGSSSGVRFEAGSSSGAGDTKHDEVAFRYATEKRQIIESDSDNDEDAYVKRLKRHVVVLEQDAELKNDQITSLQQDAALKEAQISALQSQLTSRDLTTDQLQGDLGMLMSIVYDLKAKLEKKFGDEFADKEDEQFYVGRTEQTPEHRAAAHAAAEAEREATLEAYLAAKPKKRSSKPKKKQEKQSSKQLLVMKNQDLNPLDENFQSKEPTKRPD